MSIEFDTPANRIIAAQAPKNQFRIDPTLPDLGFLRQLSIQGRLRTFSGSFGLAQGLDNSIISTVPDNGTTLFIYSARLSTTGGAITIQVKYEDDFRLSVPVIGTNGLATGVFTSPYFDSFVGDGVKELKVGYTQNVSGTKVGILLGWVENTSRIRDVAV